MQRFCLTLCVAGMVAAVSPSSRAALSAEPPGAPSYAKQIQPIFKKYCAGCHNAEEETGGLSLESLEGLTSGGDNGPVIVPGSAAQSRLVQMVEGTRKPQMPPAKKPRPTAEEIALVKAWIDAGAKPDGGEAKPVAAAKSKPQPAERKPAATPGTPTSRSASKPPDEPPGTSKLREIRPRVRVAPPVSGLAYRGDGKLLAAAVRRDVLLLDPSDGRVIARLEGQGGLLSAVAFSADGKLLAAAGGDPARAGEVKIWNVETRTVVHALAGHKDQVYAAAFSPDGKLLASAGYDRLIKLWNVATGKEERTLKDHIDAVFGLAFSPDGALLASAAADRTVKLWDVRTGKRLVTLSDALDGLNALAFHPGGKELAAGGVDKAIRIWRLEGGNWTLARSTFAHDATVLRLAYSADGATLVSTAEDGLVKLWDARALSERKVLEKQGDWVLGLALAPDGKRLAVGRYDGALRLYDTATGKEVLQPIAAVVSPPARAVANGNGEPTLVLPVLRSASPRGLRRGQTVVLTLDGVNLSDADAVYFTEQNWTGKIVPESDAEKAKNRNRVRVEVAVPATARAGIHRVFVHTPLGTTGSVPLAVGELPEVTDAERKITLPVTVVGSLASPGEADRYEFEAKAGQEIVCDVQAAAIGSSLDAVLTVLDSAGKELASNRDHAGQPGSALGYRFTKDGVYTVRIGDREYRGGGDFPYRLSVGEFPYVTGVFPLGVERGRAAEVSVRGFNLGGADKAKVEAPKSAGPGETTAVPPAAAKLPPINSPRVAVGMFPESLEREPNDEPGKAETIHRPATVNGRIGRPGDVDLYRISAKRGQPLVLEVQAQRLGSPLDSVVEVLDAGGRSLPRAVLRPVAHTYTVLRDHNSTGAGIRLESWPDWNVNDYVFLGSELLQIAALPRGPDDDVRFRSLRGQRLGLLGTTPQQHALGAIAYKVQIHPPGSTFPANGMPLFALNWRNDDGPPGYGRDSRLDFDAPADGEYLVQIGDVRGQGGDSFAYRLAVREPQPDFRLAGGFQHLSVPWGGSMPLEVTAERVDGFDGPIDVRVEGLPAGFSSTTATILPGETSVHLAVSAALDAPAPPLPATDGTGAAVKSYRVIAKAVVAGKETVRTLGGGDDVRIVTLAPPADVDVTAEPRQLSIAPGQTVRVTATIQRRNGFKGRVPIEVRNLPHGVRVTDVGLNGILITEQQTSRTFTIIADAYVAPVAQPFLTIARVETGTGPVEQAARPITLTVGSGTIAASEAPGRADGVKGAPR